jgi:hypothetical protein
LRISVEAFRSFKRDLIHARTIGRLAAARPGPHGGSRADGRAPRCAWRCDDGRPAERGRCAARAARRLASTLYAYVDATTAAQAARLHKLHGR